jgi:uncharacterized protein YggE
MINIDRLPARPVVLAGAGAALLALVLAVILVVRAAAPEGPPGTTIVPASASQQTGTTGTSGTTGAAPSGAAGAAIASDKAISAAPVQTAPNSASSSAVPIGPPCAAAPTVQFQGRGLAVTGMAPVVVSQPQSGTMSLSVSIQQTGTDPATVIGGVQAKVSAVESALQKAGVPAADVQQSYFNTYGSPQSRQFSAYASITAQVAASQVADATKAVLGVDGVTGYSTSTGSPAQPSQDEMQAAVTNATSQATGMAQTMARAANVRLGSIDSVVTQPPSVCYGGGLPTRVVQVTITYALR